VSKLVVSGCVGVACDVKGLKVNLCLSIGIVMVYSDR